MADPSALARLLGGNNFISETHTRAQWPENSRQLPLKRFMVVENGQKVSPVAGDFNAPVTTAKASIAFSRVYIALPDCRQVASNDAERGQKGGHRVKEKTQHHDIPATSRVCWPFNGAT